MQRDPQAEPNGPKAQPGERTEDAYASSHRGTIFLLLVYLIVVIAIWGTVYLTMLERG